MIDLQQFKAAVLDMDGVITQTAKVHARAWKLMFDEYLAGRNQREGKTQNPFDIVSDYRRHVDGKPRYDGVRSFLDARHISVPEGSPDDSPDQETICGLGNRKNRKFLELLEQQGVALYEDAIEVIHKWKAAGLRVAVISSSRNCQAVLRAGGVLDLFDAKLDGNDLEERGLRGKPAPDMFLEAAAELKAAPPSTIIVEDAEAGVRAGHAGHFGLVVGVAREHGRSGLERAGADVVVRNLRVLVEEKSPALSAMEEQERLAREIGDRSITLFLDYDGTLTPIVRRPEEALLSDEARRLLRELARHCTVAVVSGRDRLDVENMVALPGLIYAGSHGFDIRGPDLQMQHDKAKVALPELDQAQETISRRLQRVEGARVERKAFALAVHYREVRNDAAVEEIRAAVEAARQHHPSLRMMEGKKLFELQPDVDWNKGRAVQWLCELLGKRPSESAIFYIGDDVTDEDAFRVIAEEQLGIGIRVADDGAETCAPYYLRDPQEVKRFLEHLVGLTERSTPSAATKRGEGGDFPTKERGKGQSSAQAAEKETESPGDESTTWTLTYDHWNPDEQPLREALCTLGNGYFATRGAADEESAGGPHYPGTYLAGGYNRLESEVAGRVIENEDLVNWPNWLCLTFRIDGGGWFSIDKVELQHFRQTLDLRRGVLERRLRFRDPKGRETALVCRRFVHMRNPHLAAIEWTLTPLNWSGTVEVRSTLDGSVTNTGVARYRALNGNHLNVLELGLVAEDAIALTVETSQSRIRMVQGARTQVLQENQSVVLDRTTRKGDRQISQHLSARAEAEKPLRIEKIVAIYTSRDFAISEPRIAVSVAMRRAGSFRELLDAHEKQWRQLWNRADIIIANDNRAQMILRLHLFHLLQTTSFNSIDQDAGVPPRGLHGEAYRGHIFWDELFIFPFLNLRIPEVTRSLLMYRFRRLGEARHLAAESGFRGAMFPWQSGSSGREESQVLHLNPKSGRWIPDNTFRQRHINAAIAFDVWQYFQATDDMEFLSQYGAEMLLEIARFWASIATYNSGRGRYEISDVVGPDEFHTQYPDSDSPGLRNNAYTNVMAAWVLRIAPRALQLLAEDRRAELVDQLGLQEEEFEHWKDISGGMWIPFHDDGIISQFEGYGELKEFDWEGYRTKYGDIQRLDRILEAEGDSVNRYKASKQADVLMLFYLFSADELRQLFSGMGYSLEPDQIPKNIRYYLARTSHGSTLSRVVHSWVLARADRKRSWQLFQDALKSDLTDVQGGTTTEGIHLGAMAGTVDLIQRCYTGLEMREEALWLDPMLPDELQEVRLRIRYRGHWLRLRVQQESVTVQFEHGWSGPAKVGLQGRVHVFEEGDEKTFARKEHSQRETPRKKGTE